MWDQLILSVNRNTSKEYYSNILEFKAEFFAASFVKHLFFLISEAAGKATSGLNFLI